MKSIGSVDIVGEEAILEDDTEEVEFLDESATYVSIPIETLNKVIELLDDARGFLYIGNTERAMKSIEAAKLELSRDD